MVCCRVIPSGITKDDDEKKKNDNANNGDVEVNGQEWAMEKNADIDRAFNEVVEGVVVDGDSIATSGQPKVGGGNIATDETVD